MPTFDFKCPKCNFKFSEFVSISKKDKVTCPKCGQKAKQLFTGFNFVSSNPSSGSSCSTCGGGSCSTCGT